MGKYFKMDIFITGSEMEIILRLVVSLLLGFIIGIDRELTNKSAGLRTHILLSLGSTIFTIISIYGFSNIMDFDGSTRLNDPARVAAQILTGIGFIGGGVVLHHGVSIYGLTTAASLWITASVGMAVGTGSYKVATISTLMAFLVLVLIRKLETSFLYKLTKKEARIKLKINCKKEYTEKTQEWLFETFYNVLKLDTKRILEDENIDEITALLDIHEANPVQEVYKKIKKLKNIESVTLTRVSNKF